MYKVEKDTLKHAYKPFDIVSDVTGSVGFIKEVNVNTCQSTPSAQISYSICWLYGPETKVAWFNHKELTKHCNLFFKIAESTVNNHSSAGRWVEKLFNQEGYE